MRLRPVPLTLAAAAVLASGVVATAVPSSAATGVCDPFGPATVDPAVPTSQQVLGLTLGDRDVTAAESDTYLQAISAASAKVSDGVLGYSVQGRPLRYAVAGKAEWVTPTGLQKLSANIKAIRDPATSATTAASLIRSTPQILWVAGNVHGTEESGTDASLRALYELAARTDCAATSILDEAVVVVLPMQNPDGRELDTRRNALGFDMNRDWFARTQPETDGKVELLRQLPPQVFIDDHEMGNQDFFFPPNADPVYHDIAESPLSWIYGNYGPAMQASFDRFKYKYFNGSTYDLFYMGYGDTVPLAGFNAAGMTFEKSSTDKASIRVQQQYTAIWTTLSAAAAQGDSMLTQWRAEFVKAQQEGADGVLEPNKLYYEGATITNLVPTTPVRHYFVRNDDPAKSPDVARLVRSLQRMDVKVYQLTKTLRVTDFTAYGRPATDTALPAGTYWIPMAQAQKHWVQAMLNEDPYVPFPYFYDVTAWSLPLLDNVSGGRSGLVLSPSASLVAPVADPGAAPLPTARRVAVWEIGAPSGRSFESVGWMHWYLQNRLAQPYVDVSGTDVAGGALTGVDVLIVTDGTEKTALQQLGNKGQKALADWVKAGGTLIALRESARLAVDLGITTATYTAATSDVPGALVRTEVAPGALGAGVGPTAWAMYEYDDVWRTPTPATAAVTFPGAGDPDWFVSGYSSGADELRGTVSVVDEQVGSGRVVLFASDPNYRAFTDGTQKILRNALARLAPTAPVAPLKLVSSSSTTAPSLRDSLVISVLPSAKQRVLDLLSAYGATAETFRTSRGVTFVVGLGGLTAEEHPWARRLASDAAALGGDVLAIKLP